MADNAETQSYASELEQLREELRRRIAQIRAERDRETREYQEEKLREQLEKDLEDKKTAAREVSREGAAKKRQEAKEVMKTVAKVLEAVKEGVIEPPEKSKAVLSKLAEKGLTEQTSSALHKFIQTFLDEDISISKPGDEQTKFEKEFEILKAKDPTAAEMVRDAVIQTAEDIGVTREQAESKFSVPEEQKKFDRRELTDDEAQYERDREYTFKTFYREKEDLDTLRALYISEEFVQLADKTRRETEHKINNDPTMSSLSAEEKKSEIGRRTSEEIERKIVLLFSKIYRNMDTFPPDKFFEEVEQAGFMESISVAKETFNKRFNQLIDKLSRIQDELPQELKDIFYKRYTEQSLGTKPTKLEDGTIENFNYYKLTPTPTTDSTSLVDFLRGIGTQIVNEEAARRYLHNIRALFFRKPEEGKGFWEQLAGYSQSFTAVDVDSLMTLPDSTLFVTANRLYQKYLEEAMATVSWIHQPNMFSPDLYTITTNIEKKVSDDLRKLFPDLATEGIEDWRLRRALSMGIGLARGVLLNEVETAAWADPHLSFENGKPTYTSYYTNDNAALNALNPAHHFLRWQTESVTRGGLIFLLTEGFDPSQRRVWDHSVIFERIKYFRDSFEKGVPALERKNPNERMFFELLPNIGRAGSLITRGGWRTDAAYDGWVIRPTGVGERWDIKDERGGIKVPETWKAIENIGYEVVYHFVEHKLFSGDNLKSFILSTDPAKMQLRDEFFNYVYQKYISPFRPSGETLEAYLKSLRGGVEEGTLKELKGKISLTRKELDLKIQEELYRMFMRRALGGMLRQRIPTKFIRIERNRLSEDGQRAWETLRQRLNWDNEEMDEAMQNLGLVEAQLRQLISLDMKEYLTKQGKAQDLSTFQTNEYVVTEEKIRQILSDANIGSDSAVKLFQKINEFLDERKAGEYSYIEKFTEKIRTKNAAGEGLPKDIPFALATEELDNTFLAWRSAGPTPLSRALGDTSTIEQHVTNQIQAYYDLLEQVALDPNHDISEMIKRLKDMKYTLEKIHDTGTATQLAYRMAAMTIAYFKKDTVARVLGLKWFRFGKKNSLAAEFTGAYRGVWEWDVAEIDTFVTELERWNILPKEPFDKVKAKVEHRKFLGIIPYRKVIQEKAFEYYGKKIREQFGATWKHKIYEFANKYLPFILLFVVWTAFSKAFKEEFGEKKR